MIRNLAYITISRLGLRGSSDVAFWRVTNQAQPSVKAKFDACRREGLRTTTVRYLKEAS